MPTPSTARVLALPYSNPVGLPGRLGLTQAPHYLGTDGPLAPVPAPRPTYQLPDGQTITLAPRGVQWSCILVDGCPVLCAPDRNGDIAHRWRPVPRDATPEQVETIKRQLREMLDEADPVRVTVVR